MGAIVPVPMIRFAVGFVCGSKRVNSFVRLCIHVCLFWPRRRFVKVPARPLRGGCSGGLLVLVLVDDDVGVVVHSRLIREGRSYRCFSGGLNHIICCMSRCKSCIWGYNGRCG